MTMLSTETLETLRQRRSAGERVKDLAAEVGIVWQRLDKAMRNGLRGELKVAAPFTPALPLTRRSTGPLVDQYRPKRLADLWGQDAVVKVLSKFAAAPHPKAFLFEGETGTGKTSAALALAAELGCEVAQQEFGGVHMIASGEQTSDTVREAYNRLFLTPMMGSGWKVLIVNEADRMGTPAETIWLDRLEALPRRSVVIFTTNYTGKLNSRFRDRCARLEFASDEKAVAESARKMLAAVWLAETGQAITPATVRGVMKSAVEDGKISFRRLLQVAEMEMEAA